MKKLMVAMLLSLPAISQADVIKCSFTEPFFNVTYSMAQQSLTIVSPESPNPAVLRHISFQIPAPAGKKAKSS